VKRLFIFLQTELNIRTWRIHVYTHMALGKNKEFFLTHLDSALAHTLAYIVYVLTTRNGSLTLCLFTHKWITVEYRKYAQIKFWGLHRNQNVPYICHTDREHCYYLLGQKPLKKWKYRIHVPISGMEKLGIIPIFGQKMAYLTHCLKFCSQIILNGTVGNLDV
jgi:hypothetical protein